MARRPLCLVCLLLMLAMTVADLLGVPLIRGNPLPGSVTEYITKHPETTICGEVERCTESENSKSVYLKNVYFIYQSEKISIKNVRVFLKNQDVLYKGMMVRVKGRLEEIQGKRNPGEFPVILFMGSSLRICSSIWEIFCARWQGKKDKY